MLTITPSVEKKSVYELNYRTTIYLEEMDRLLEQGVDVPDFQIGIVQNSFNAELRETLKPYIETQMLPQKLRITAGRFSGQVSDLLFEAADELEKLSASSGKMTVAQILQEARNNANSK